MLRVLIALVAAGALFGQETAFDRLKREAARTKALTLDHDKYEDPAGAVRGLHIALRDRIESRLPQQGATGRELTIWRGPGLGYVGSEFKLLPELPNELFVIVHASVDCGSDDAVYMYRYVSIRG